MQRKGRADSWAGGEYPCLRRSEALAVACLDLTWHEPAQLSAQRISVHFTKAVLICIHTATSRAHRPRQIVCIQQHHVHHEQLHHRLLLPGRKTSFAMPWW